MQDRSSRSKSKNKALPPAGPQGAADSVRDAASPRHGDRYSHAELLARSNAALRSEVEYRKKAEAAMRTEAERLAALVNLQLEIAKDDLDLYTVMQLVVERTQQLLSAAADCSILRVEGDDLVTRAVTNPFLFPLGMRVRTDALLAGECARTGEIILCPDVQKDPRANKRLAKQTNIRSLFVLPIYFGAGIAGVFRVTSHKVNAFENTDVQIARLMAGIVSTSLEHDARYSERREAELELQRILEQTEQILISIPSILIGTDEHGMVFTWNMAARDVFGVSRDEVLGKPLLECPISWDHDSIAAAMATCSDEGVVVRLEDVRYASSGQEGILGITMTPMSTANGASMGLLILGADVTERRVLERQLSQAQKLESIGQLAAGVAHEINTPIQYVGDNTRFLQDAFRDISELLAAYAGLLKACKAEAKAQGIVHEVEQAAEKADLDYLMQEVPNAISQSLEGVERVAHIVMALKEFSHPGSAEKSQIDLNHALESTITVARNEWKYVADLIMELDPSLPLVSCHPEELNQVFLNLIVNAAQAVGDVVKKGGGDKGTITVRTRCTGDSVEVQVEDTGGGVPMAIRSRLFDPFFTTKEVGKGTGQGLAIARSVVVDKHAGTIDFSSQIGKGTTFIVRLPIAPAQQKQAA